MFQDSRLEGRYLVDDQALTDPVAFSLIAALVLVIAVALVYIFYRNRQRSENLARQQKITQRERFRNAVWSSAVVIASSSMAGQEKNRGKALVRLELDVETPEGQRYPARANWWVASDYLHLLRPGESVLVRIDQQDGMRIYPNVEWAEPYEWGEE